ncbi:alpha/beta fold hydrolase [Kitasatospora sp. NPDC052896]|uniref:alpha/beta fold hydrolase n=1 Tax=Kitasatospora sp. NPDC052896 TaxID=3364061 RepID=UPI0037C5E384
MARAMLKGLEVEYRTTGRRTDPALLLIAGLGSQLTFWEDEFCELLADHGLWVVRYDNRDTGLTSTVDEAGPQSPYGLDELADDAAGLLDVLGVTAAHVAGFSMGGMIAQRLTIDHPARVLSLCSISSLPGDGVSGQARPGVISTLFPPAEPGRESAVEAGVFFWGAVASPDYPTDPVLRRARVAAAVDRAHRPDGLLRQLLALRNATDRTAALGAVTVPTLVVHGEADPLIEVSGGRATAAAVPGARLWSAPGMGHELPRQLWPALVAEIVANARI